MGLSSTLATSAAAAVAAIGTETARPEIDNGPALQESAIVSTFTPAPAESQAEFGADAQDRVDGLFAVSAQPEQEQSTSGSLLRRRSERQQEATQPPTSTAPASGPVSEPASTQPAQQVAPQPAVDTQPAAATQPETQPAVTPAAAPEAEVWKPMTQEQIERLTPAEMTRLIGDLEKRSQEATTSLRVTQDRTALYQNVTAILAAHKEQGASAQIRALNEFFNPGFNAELEGLRYREGGIREMRRASAAELVNGVPRPIVDTVEALNANRRELGAAIEGNRVALEGGKRDSWTFYTETNRQVRDAYLALGGLNVQLPGNLGVLGGIFGRNREPTPEEQRQADQQRQQEMDKVELFNPLKELRDPAGSPEVIDALRPVDLSEAVTLVMGPGGQPTLTAGEMRVRVVSLNAEVAAAVGDAERAAIIERDAARGIDEVMVGVPGKDNPVRQRIDELLRTRQELTARTVQIERDELAAQTPNMNPAQFDALNTYVTIKTDEAQLGWNTAIQTNETNWGIINGVNQSLHEWSTNTWAEYNRWALLRSGNFEGIIFGR